MTKPAKQDIARALEKAWDAFYKRDFDGALEQFEEIMEEDDSAAALFGRACALFRCQENDGALKDLNALLKMDPKNTTVLHTRALVYGDEEKYKESIRDLEKVVELLPDSVEAWCDLGGACLLKKDFPRANDCFDKCIDLDKSCPDAWFGKGMVALEKKEARRAIEYLNAAIKLDGKYLLALLARSEAHFLFKQDKEAQSDLSKVLSLDPDIFKNAELDGEDQRDDFDSDDEETLDDSSELESFN